MTDWMDHIEGVVLPPLVAACDDAALATVQSGRGGPFGASVSVLDIKSGAVETVTGPVGNAVLQTGLAGAHAEDRALQPDHMRALRAALSRTGAENVVLIIASSAESCPACHAKIEIAVRHLVADGLLRPGHAVLGFGADYHDTRHVAGFYDAPYRDDMTRAAAQRMIPVVESGDELPVPARVVLNDGTVCDGVDGRDANAPILTAEARAIYAACSLQKSRGADAPWNLNGATLLTTAPETGPLMYAESQWANIGRIVRCAGPVAPGEAPGVANGDLFRVIAARPYNGPGATVRVVRVRPFANRAQHEWARLQDEGKVTSYNGVETA